MSGARRAVFVCVALVALAGSLASAQENLMPARASEQPLITAAAGEYTNPVYSADQAADPTVLRAADGTFYAYTTQRTTDGTGPHFPVLHSFDLVNWDYLGDAMPDLPKWATTGPERDTWAPHVIFRNEKFYMYFTARRASSDQIVIGVATSDSPEGPFTPVGLPLVGKHSLDAFVMETDKGLFMYWTVYKEPIRVQQLTDDGLRLIGEPRMLLRPNADRRYQKLVEGPWIVKHGSRYYMFFSGDHCCGVNAHYALMVARSDHPRRGFKKRPGRPILLGNAQFDAPGHNAVVTDDAGQDWILYHAIAPSDEEYGRHLMLDKIEWKNGWPTINNGDGPSSAPRNAPAIALPE